LVVANGAIKIPMVASETELNKSVKLERTGESYTNAGYDVCNSYIK